MKLSPADVCPSSIAFGCKVSSIQRQGNWDEMPCKCPRNIFIHFVCFSVASIFLVFSYYSVCCCFSFPPSSRNQISRNCIYFESFGTFFSPLLYTFVSFSFKLPYILCSKNKALGATTASFSNKLLVYISEIIQMYGPIIREAGDALSIFSSPYFIGRENTASSLPSFPFILRRCCRLAIKVNSSFQNL